jgi:hypothetical protein
MPHKLQQWPERVYPDETDEFPEARADIDAALLELARQGPSPLGYQVKNLGKSKGGLWQLNLKVHRKQLRILYAPYKYTIVVFRIHKKSSPQEQQRAYALAITRKKEAEEIMKGGADVGSVTVH